MSNDLPLGFVRACGFHNQIPVRFEGNPQGPLGHDTRWRGVRSFEHSDLCAAFSLDPCRFSFDLPSSVRGVGSNRGGHSDARRIVAGFVFMAGIDEPVAKITICAEADRFADVDPNDPREWARLDRH